MIIDPDLLAFILAIIFLIVMITSEKSIANFIAKRLTVLFYKRKE